MKQNENEIQAKNDIGNLITEGLQNNPTAFTADVVKELSNARNKVEAASILAKRGVSLQDPLDAMYKKAQINKIYADIAGVGDASTDPAQILAYAQQYASTGTIPTGIPKGQFGVVSQVAKELPKSPGQILDKATGIVPDKLGAAGDAYGSLYSAIQLANQLKDLDKQRVGGVVSGTFGKLLGSKDQQAYVDLRSQIVDLLSRARSGAALTVSEEKRYGDMLPGRFSEPLGFGAQSHDRIDNFVSALTSDLTNKVDSKGWVVNGISKVKIGGTQYTVGDVIQNAEGQLGRVNPDGSVTLISQ